MSSHYGYVFNHDSMTYQNSSKWGWNRTSLQELPDSYINAKSDTSWLSDLDGLHNTLCMSHPHFPSSGSRLKWLLNEVLSAHCFSAFCLIREISRYLIICYYACFCRFDHAFSLSCDSHMEFSWGQQTAHSALSKQWLEWGEVHYSLSSEVNMPSKATFTQSLDCLNPETFLDPVPFLNCVHTEPCQEKSVSTRKRWSGAVESAVKT